MAASQPLEGASPVASQALAQTVASEALTPASEFWAPASLLSVPPALALSHSYPHPSALPGHPWHHLHGLQII